MQERQDRDLQIWATIRQFGGKVGQRTISCNFEVMGCVEKAKDLTQGKRQWSIFHLGCLFDTVLDHKQIRNSFFFLYIGILFWARVIWCLGFGWMILVKVVYREWFGKGFQRGIDWWSFAGFKLFFFLLSLSNFYFGVPIPSNNFYGLISLYVM